MKIPVQKSDQLKSIAILMMLCLHLFNREYHNIFQPLLFMGKQPLSYYISLFSDGCVPIFAFVSGYGLYFSFKQNPEVYLKKNIERSKKLYLRYWIILLLFAVLLGWLLQKEGYPGTWGKFILNFSGLVVSYNGAWWFFTIYILFVFTSKFWFRLLDKLNPYLFFVALLIIYVVAFYFRVYKPHLLQNSVLEWFQMHTSLYFATLFQFMLGSFALKYRWNDKVSSLLQQIKFKNFWAFLGITLLVGFRGFIIPNYIITPFTGLIFIFLFLQMDLGKYFNKFLDFFTAHSTNIWLVHLFFCGVYFKPFIYSPQYPPLIILLLVACCLVASYIINLLYNTVYSTIK